MSRRISRCVLLKKGDICAMKSDYISKINNFDINAKHRDVNENWEELKLIITDSMNKSIPRK